MQIKPNYITVFLFFLSMSIGSCNCKKDPADGDKNKIHSSNSTTSNSTTSNSTTSNSTTSNSTRSNPPASNPPASNPTSNPISTSSSSSTDDSSDSEENAKSNSPLLPPLQNLPISVNNNKPAANNSVMPITDDMIQTLRSSRGTDRQKDFEKAFADRLEEIKNGTVQVGDGGGYYEYKGVNFNLIYVAIRVNRLDILKALVELDAKVLVINQDAESALNVACKLGKLEMVKFLFSVPSLKNNGFNQVGADQNTALMAAVRSKNLAVVEYIWYESLKVLSGDESVIKIHFAQKDIKGQTPLDQAKADGSQDIVKFLVSKGF